jgi:HD-GYP domain-containing protein (c-di-GMP phosphodiesterase class II)
LRIEGHDIPLVSRIVSVIDAYDAWSPAAVTARTAARGSDPTATASSGTQFDSEVVQAFIPIAEQEADEVFAAAGTSSSAAL